MIPLTPLAPLALVAAVARNGVIGKNGQLPWSLPDDRRHFHEVTRGHAVIMGRRTWEETGRPLEGRRNLVVTRTPGAAFAGAEVYPTLAAAIAHARATDPEPCIIGGSGIYREALPLVTRMYLTEVDRDVDGDTHFPAYDRREFREVARRAGGDPGVTYVTLERVAPHAS